jgi:hypothetical protein
VSSLGQLLRLSENTDDWAAGTYFELTADLDASDTSTWNAGDGFSPIGNFSDPFLGSFDGNSHVITGLTIDRNTQDSVGLFGYAGSGSSIRNVGLEGSDILGRDVVGGLVGENLGAVSSSYAAGSVWGYYLIGGLVGKNVGTLSSCYATGSVSGDYYVGGLVGGNDSMVSSSYATRSVSGDGDVGGLVGQNSGTVTSSYWDTETSGQATSAGGGGLTSAQMLLRSSFIGFDFTVTPDWKIANGFTLPYLPWQSASLPIYVDFAAAPGGDGSESNPFDTLLAGVNAVDVGGYRDL